MNNQVRSFYLDLIDLVNKYEDIPWEVKRIVLDDVQLKAAQKADACIREEIGKDGFHVDTLILGGNEDAEVVQQNQLGELPE